MANDFNTILGNTLEWHTECKGIILGRPVIYAYAFKVGFDNDDIANEVHFTTHYFVESSDKTKMIAWAYIDENVIRPLFDEWKKEEKELKKDNINKKISELEKELEILKTEQKTL